MTKYFCKNQKDKELINNSFYTVAYLIFGKKGKKKIDTFLEHFEKNVSQVNVFSQGTRTEYLNEHTPGICRADSYGNIIVEMLGHEDASVNKYSFIRHEGVHEFCHAFVDLLSKIFAKYPNGIIKKGVLCQNHLGLIKETNPATGEFVGPHYYGKMYNETMMDIMTTIAINCCDSRNNGQTVDSILNNNYHQWGGEITGYSIFTSITRLTIAAFSNNGFINYQDVVNTGASMIDVGTKMNNGETYKANDFLYGIVFDPLHIDMEFDKFMGAGEYRKHCELLDRIFYYSLKKEQIPSEPVKEIMKNLANFINKKINYYKSNGIISLEGANKIIGNFNRIWNSMYNEYNAYFNGREIAEIAEEAKKPKKL